MKKTGTREWSDHSVNCVKGCAHGCLYCYARAFRFNPKRGLAWLDEEMYVPKIQKHDGVVMFPTRHDFTPRTIEHCLAVLSQLMIAGNNVLVVTKAGLETAKRVAQVLELFPASQSEVRFTLSHSRRATGDFWEPHAPPVSDRIDGMTFAYCRGLRTSVSCEPWLDSKDDLVELVNALEHLVSETMWIGHANNLKERTAWCMSEKVTETMLALQEMQTPEAARAVYGALKDNPKIRWKDSYRAMLGLPVQ